VNALETLRMSELYYFDQPRLDRPVMVVGFSGWPNAGDVSTGALSYLLRRLEAKPLAMIEPDNFYTFTTDRPTAKITAGHLEDLRFPRNHFSYVKTGVGERDLILFSGREPDLRWKYFAQLILDLAQDMNTQTIFTVGGTYDYVPHWVEPRVSVVYSGAAAKAALAGMTGQLSPAEYEGPISIHTWLMVRGREQGLPVVGLWGHAPVYIQTGNLNILQRLVEIIKTAAGFSLDTQDLLEGIVEMSRQIEDLIANNPRLKKYVDELKQEFQESSRPRRRSHPPSLAEGEKGKIIPFDQFLKRNDE